MKDMSAQYAAATPDGQRHILTDLFLASLDVQHPGPDHRLLALRIGEITQRLIGEMQQRTEEAPEGPVTEFQRGYRAGRDGARRQDAAAAARAQAEIAALEQHVLDLEAAYDAAWCEHGGASAFASDALVLRQAERTAAVQRRADAMVAAAQHAVGQLAAGTPAQAAETLRRALARHSAAR